MTNEVDTHDPAGMAGWLMERYENTKQFLALTDDQQRNQFLERWQQNVLPHLAFRFKQAAEMLLRLERESNNWSGVASTRNRNIVLIAEERDAERSKRLQAEHERDVAVERLAQIQANPVAKSLREMADAQDAQDPNDMIAFTPTALRRFADQIDAAQRDLDPESKAVLYGNMRELARAVNEPKTEPIYGSLTARDPNDVTRSPWTKTGWWLPVEVAEPRECRCATYCMQAAGMRSEPPLKCRGLTGEDPGAHLRFPQNRKGDV